MTTSDLAYETVFAGEGWYVEQDEDGRLYTTSNAETRQPVTPRAYHGWTTRDFAEMRDGFRREGMTNDLADRYLTQAGADVAEVYAMDKTASPEQIDGLNAEAIEIRDDEEMSDFQAISAVARRRNLSLVRETDQIRLYRLPSGELVNCWVESPDGTTFERGLGFDDQTELHNS